MACHFTAGCEVVSRPDSSQSGRLRHSSGPLLLATWRNQLGRGRPAGYFAASVFWRGSIHPWKDDGSIPVTLGPFQEQFRKYLMGEGTFPKDCSLCVVVREGTKLNRLTAFPVGERKGLFHLYRFPMPGFAFSLGVSKNIPAIYREMCFVHGVGNPIIVTPIIEKFLEEEAVKLHKRAFAAQVRRRVT